MLKKLTALFLFAIVSLNLKGETSQFLIISEDSGEYNLVVPDGLLGKDILFGSRIVDISKPSAKVYAAGQMRRPPVVVRFSKQGDMLLMHEITDFYEVDSKDPIHRAVERNSIIGAAHIFNIDSRNIDDNASIINVTDYFSEEVGLAWPLPDNLRKGKIEKKLSKIIFVRQFDDHINVRSYYEFTGGKETFALTVQYFMLLLPEEPLLKRYDDSRVGYNTNNYRSFRSGKEIVTREYINRWRIEPKTSDLNKHKRGELVEPKTPIIIYIEPYFPKQWMPYIKKGAEEWNKAFESIGFKNVIQAREFPDNSEFDPYDIKTNVIRYIPVREANAAGQTWIDPRSGEIINGEVLWWNDVVSLIKMWRFTQTASVDPEARSLEYNDKFMGEMIRYAIAHEVGHMLGLQHNMRSSYAYETDSLRSPTFTQKYGTTASIMDYARYNHIALPGDLEKGVKLNPPYLGPFDYLSIEYGYKYIHDSVDSPENEYFVLDSLLNQKQSNPMFQFAPYIASPIVPDPSAQSYTLGNDIIKSSANGIFNTGIIIDSLVEWTLTEGGSEDILQSRFDALVKQYCRYVNLPMSYLGGRYETQGPIGFVNRRFTPVSSQKQREALTFIVEYMFKTQFYLEKSDISHYLGSPKIIILEAQKDIINNLLGNFILPRIVSNNNIDYDLNEFLDHFDRLIWFNSDNDSPYIKNIHISYISALKKLSNKSTKDDATVSDYLIGEAVNNQLLKLKFYLRKRIEKSSDNSTHLHYLLKIIEA